ncbi:MAG: PQQ enzyme repeat-containing [Bacteroidetes bacterium]|nr:MAG: PQQ enzyme repeat-containing [Bacteroidota bacterium]
MKSSTRFFIFLICFLAYACQEKNDDDKNSPPAQPTLIAPSNADDNVNTSLNLVWECVDPDNDSVTYNVFFSANNPPDSLVTSNLVPASYSIAGLESSKTYFWQVVAKDSYGNETKGPVWSFSTIIDFRDGFTGNYNCLVTRSYFCPSGDTMNWCKDTLADNKQVLVEKVQERFLLIRVSESYSFEAEYQEWNNTFECTDCPGPPDYIRFFPNDSIYVYVRVGVLDSYNYYGIKIDNQ